MTGRSKGNNNEAVVFDLIVVGGGAAGFYSAIQAGDRYPGLKILILEKSAKVLSKVRVSGGGRCNVTHNCFDPLKLSRHYPRGQKALRSLYAIYQASDVVNWFASRGISLKTEDDGRMFPVTDSSQTIINCFLEEAKRLLVEVKTGVAVTSIRQAPEMYELISSSGTAYRARRVIMATGGSPKKEAYDLVEALGHTIKPPIPSLFTFNDSKKQFSDLMGVSVPAAEVRIAKTRFTQHGPLLITHWGLSGPAVIRLSAWAAEYLNGVGYDFVVHVSWIGHAAENEVREYLLSRKTVVAKQTIQKNPLYGLPQRLWERLCILAEIPENKIWADIAHRNVNKLLENLIRCAFHIKGKTTFKEEFVTCGGIDLNEVDLNTMESRLKKGLFLAGEVLDVDGETGGFNFQAAWSTAFVAAANLFK